MLFSAQNAQKELSAAAAAAVVREAQASAVMDVFEGESAEEKACKIAAAKEERMRKVIRCGCFVAFSPFGFSTRVYFLHWLAMGAMSLTVACCQIRALQADSFLPASCALPCVCASCGVSVLKSVHSVCYPERQIENSSTAMYACSTMRSTCLEIVKSN